MAAAVLLLLFLIAAALAFLAPSVSVEVKVRNNTDIILGGVSLGDINGEMEKGVMQTIAPGETANFRVIKNFEPEDNLLVLFVESNQARVDVLYLPKGFARERMVVSIYDSPLRNGFLALGMVQGVEGEFELDVTHFDNSDVQELK
ncbi:MAG: hypothetical protein FWE46_03360 [Coriobacteriia bacterium]|nr:hypothetical protein [Coriobacteriia bacterium]MCL2537345.1 hypothetical protein [Coriobacteriia bacterium]